MGVGLYWAGCKLISGRLAGDVKPSPQKGGVPSNSHLWDYKPGPIRCGGRTRLVHDCKDRVLDSSTRTLVLPKGVYHEGVIPLPIARHNLFVLLSLLMLHGEVTGMDDLAQRNPMHPQGAAGGGINNALQQLNNLGIAPNNGNNGPQAPVVHNVGNNVGRNLGQVRQQNLQVHIQAARNQNAARGFARRAAARGRGAGRANAPAPLAVQHPANNGNNNGAMQVQQALVPVPGPQPPVPPVVVNHRDAIRQRLQDGAANRTQVIIFYELPSSTFGDWFEYLTRYHFLTTCSVLAVIIGVLGLVWPLIAVKLQIQLELTSGPHWSWLIALGVICVPIAYLHGERRVFADIPNTSYDQNLNGVALVRQSVIADGMLRVYKIFNFNAARVYARMDNWVVRGIVNCLNNFLCLSYGHLDQSTVREISTACLLGYNAYSIATINPQLVEMLMRRNCGSILSNGSYGSILDQAVALTRSDNEHAEITQPEWDDCVNAAKVCCNQIRLRRLEGGFITGPVSSVIPSN